MPISPDLKISLIAAIEASREKRERFLARLVQTPSSNPPGDCAPIAAVAAEMLEALGLEVERHTVPEETVRELGMISCTNLVVRRRFGDGPVVALNAHGDVVAPGEGWTHPPFAAEIADEFMYGRGVAVSKSDFATYAFALLALETIAERLRGTVELHFTFDEEVGGLIGPKWLLENGIVKPDLCISAGFSYSVVTAHNGVLHLQVTVHGKSAHAAAPDTGHDALQGMTAILQALYAERERYPAKVSDHPGIGHPNLTVGLISGGINTNVVPDKVKIRLDRRMIPEECPAEVEAHLRQVIAGAISGSQGLRVEIERVLLASPLRQLPGAERLIEPIRRHAGEILGEEPTVEGVPLYTDARLYAEAGIPTVSYGAGPRSFLEANGHRADEKLRLSDLHAATAIVALTLAEVLGGSTYPRDMVGYGRNPPDPKWPGSALVAVQFVVNYEEGGESNVLHGDPASESLLSEIVGAQPWPSERHMNMESIYEYGSRAGFWRLWRMFTSRGVPVTVFGVATAMARNPEAVAAMQEADWEIASHGLKWLEYRSFPEDEERRHIAEAIRIQTELTGSRPLGFYQGKASVNTTRLVMEEGGFLYSSDSYADELPYWIAGPRGPHLIVPYTLDANDMRFATAQGFNSGDQFFSYLKDSFDVLYAEGKAGAPKMLSVGLHCRLVGRPGRAAALERFLDYVQAKRKVWLTRRIDIARHWRAVHAP